MSEPKQVETNLSTPLPVHVTGINQIVLQENKTRPTWTRLARMEYRPRGNDGDIIKPMLGKRELQELEVRKTREVEDRLRYRRVKQRGCWSTLAKHNEAIIMELPRVSEPFDSS